MEQINTIGEKIKQLRLNLKMTQTDFSELIECTQATLSAYENNSKLPSLDSIITIAKKCQVSLDWLCDISDIKTINRERIEKYADLFKIIILVSNSVPLRFNIDGFGELENYAIIFDDIFVEDFMNKWYKIKLLYDDSTIDKETYHTIMESIIAKYENNSIVPFNEDGDDIVY